MILNEDYFDELKLTDDDISAQDYSSTVIDATPEEWFRVMKSKYSHYILIRIEHHTINENEVWENRIPHSLRNLQYMFDVYGIDYSLPTVQDFPLSKIIDNYRKCVFIDFHNYKLITMPDSDWKNNILYIVMYFNLPKVRSYKEACQFVGNMVSCILNNKEYNQNYPFFYIYSVNDSSSNCVVMNKIGSIGYEYNKIHQTWMIDVISMFFPEKPVDAIRRELDSDRHLS